MLQPRVCSPSEDPVSSNLRPSAAKTIFSLEEHVRALKAWAGRVTKWLFTVRTAHYQDASDGGTCMPCARLLVLLEDSGKCASHVG